MIGETVETTSDDRVMAALAHFFGLVAALLIWATQKERSRFVRFQALQAMAFDAVFMVAYMLLLFCAMGAVFLVVLEGVWTTLQAAPSESVFPGMFVGIAAPWLMFSCLMPLALGVMIIRIVAAVSVATGHNFRYPLIAARVESFVGGP